METRRVGKKGKEEKNEKRISKVKTWPARTAIILIRDIAFKKDVINRVEMMYAIYVYCISIILQSGRINSNGHYFYVYTAAILITEKDDLIPYRIHL